MPDYGQLHKRISDIFSTKSDEEDLMEAIDIFLYRNYSDMNAIYMSSIMSKIGKKVNKERIKPFKGEWLIKIVNDIVERKTKILGSKDFGSILYGLHGISVCEEMYKLVELMGNEVKYINNLDGTSVGSAVYGLHNMKGDERVYDFLEKLSICIEHLYDFGGQEISNAIYGLQNMSADKRVYKFLAVLSSKIKFIYDLDAHHIGSALYGLHNLKEEKRVYQCIELLGEKAESIYDFNGRNIGNILYGLQKLTGNKRVYRFIDIISKKAAVINDYDQQNIGNSIYGLQNITATESVYQCINILHEKVKKINNVDARHISNIVYGLQNMKGEERVYQFLETLREKLLNCNECTEQDIGNMLFGLRNMGEDERVYKFVTEVVSKVNNNHNFISQHIGNALYGISILSSSRIEKLIHLLLEKYRNIPTNDRSDMGQILFSLYNKRGFIEEKYIDYFKKKYDQQSKYGPKHLLNYQMIHVYNVPISKEVENEYEALIQSIPTGGYEAKVADVISKKKNRNYEPCKFYNGFELDLYNRETKVNIELDGEVHKLPIKKHHDAIRDIYLSRQGIQIYRISTAGKSIKEVVEEVQEKSY